MSVAFQFELVSPERLLLSTQVTEVVIPGSEGYLTALAGHSPLMTTIMPGIVSVKTPDGKADSYVVYGGFADISANGCSILAESATHIDELDRSDLQRRIDEARHSLDNSDNHEHRTKLEAFLHQLMTLQGAILPA
ncbi:F-type H+-transporting ATPase subunit epsilon [Paenochrobactrum gallinarii]|uniref:ATP synthase epsilon chain n=1 Tax=Paenochrobactrum gallinarii TaxID=643673 RepID=A0A841LXR8_9HYPH|nr:F0F1 ATP synthase subunit epsilon [Paenochrobactrum gallinarii]MBB6261342.1 F-type H+-transporting ATPase subunit epsilon [Paenochrobactrum gallinarii]